MITPETTVTELGSILAPTGKQVRAYYDASASKWKVLLSSPWNAEKGTGPDLITALNDALGKVGNGRS